jgi:hypothetical protein
MWAPEPVWMLLREEKLLAPAWNRTPAVKWWPLILMELNLLVLFPVKCAIFSK